MLDVTAIVVAADNSRRLPGKALLPFNGATLVAHKIDQLKRVRGLSRIVLIADTDRILAEHRGVKAIRDVRYQSANDMIGSALAAIRPCDAVMWAHPTNPNVTPKIYDDAIAIYCTLAPEFDGLASVRMERRHAWCHGHPVNHHPVGPAHQLAKDLEPIAFQDGAIFMRSFESFKDSRQFTGLHPFLFAIDPALGVDIDTRQDYELALWYASQSNAPPHSVVAERSESAAALTDDVAAATGGTS